MIGIGGASSGLKGPNSSATLKVSLAGGAFSTVISAGAGRREIYQISVDSNNGISSPDDPYYVYYELAGVKYPIFRAQIVALHPSSGDVRRQKMGTYTGIIIVPASATIGIANGLDSTAQDVTVHISYRDVT